MDLLADAFPCGPIYSIPEVFADPQVRHLGETATVGAPGDDRIEVLTHPLHFSRTPALIRTGVTVAEQEAGDLSWGP